MSMDFFWEQFGIECAEHLQVIDQCLADALTHACNPEDIAKLFRSMHSIKGLSKAMGLLSMELVAHRCEDLLGLVRDNGVDLSRDLIELLTVANDTLARLHETIVEQRLDQPPNDALIAKLDAAFQHFSGGVSSSADLPVSDTQNQTEVEDADPLFAALRVFAPQTSELIHEICDAWFGKGVAAPRKVAKPLSALIERVEAAGFDGLLDILTAVSQSLAKKPADMDAEWIGAMADLGQQLRDLEAGFELNFGAEFFRAIVPNHFDAVSQAVAGPLAELSLSLPESGYSEEALADAMASLGQSLRQIDLVLAFADPRNRSQNLQLKLQSIYAAEDIASAFASLLVQIDHIRDAIFDQLVSGDQSQDCFNFLVALQGAVTPDASAPKEKSASQLLPLLQSIGLNDDFAACTPLEFLPDLAALAEGASQGVLVTIDLNGNPQAARLFVQWSKTHEVKSISRSVIVQDMTLFEFLIISQSSANILIEDLKRDLGDALMDVQKVGAVAKSDSPAPQAAALEAQSTPSASQPAPAPNATPTSTQSQIRVSAAVLDSFMAQVGCLVSVRSRLGVALQDEGVSRLMESVSDLGRRLSAQGHPEDALLLDRLRAAVQDERMRLATVQVEFQRHLSSLQQTALDLRVLPLSNLFARLPRIVRELGTAQGKELRFVMSGGETVVDKSIIETLVDPLIHIVRNAVDHGIETPQERQAAGKSGEASLTLAAVQEGGEAKLSIIDDGRGINVERVAQKALERGLTTPEKLKSMTPEQIIYFIFEAGFSTAAAITETSGRGVGMDIVRTAVLGIGGKIAVSSELGKGSRFDITIPVSAAIQNTLVVRLGDHLMGIPSRYVDEVHQIARSELRTLHDQTAYLLRGHVLPLYSLEHLLMGSTRGDDERVLFVVVSAGGRRIGLIVDGVVRREEMFLTKPHPLVRRSPYLFSATVSGEGKIILIVDVDGVMTRLAQGA